MTAPAAGADSPARRLARLAIGVGAVMVVYYAVPLGDRSAGEGVVTSVLGVVTGAALLVWLALRQVRLLASREAAGGTARLDGLVLLVVIVVPMFAAAYFGLEQADVDQFASLATRTDALYFSLSVLATVGFGDVHATGQLARGLVTLQMAFDLVFVGAVVSVVSDRLRQRSVAHRAPQPAVDPDRPDL